MVDVQSLALHKGETRRRRSDVAELRAKPEQAKVLHYEVDGGIRRKGDPGATRYDVPVGANAAHTDQFGGIAKGALKKVAKVAGKEKKDRKTATGRRAALRGQRLAATSEKQRSRVALRLKPLKWITKSGNEPGTFVGKIGDTRGYWTRPGRSFAAPVRRKGLRSVQSRGDNKPKLILAFADHANYRKRLKFADVVARARLAKMSTSNFSRELARVQARRTSP
ncbi:hypothetical protein HFO93_24555 [Rhizobium leguminosarum]|uniref:hypothetical protein n=1 Tax=Rhizobium leguminosarum TaxID=384 RepID=UPI001C94BD21|nr:hypothetical protein [Rhizobium leguminosarum]MBY5446587.1 hypothetical protein [Rhizobium leguminosarum]